MEKNGWTSARMHRAHVDYSNISIPNANNNIAKFTFDLKVEITNRQTGSSSSYVPPETETEPVDNNDEGDDDPCGGSSSGSSSSPNSSSSNPCPNGDNGGDEDEIDPDNPFSPDDCMDNRGGSPGASAVRITGISVSYRTFLPVFQPGIWQLQLHLFQKLLLNMQCGGIRSLHLPPQR